MALLDLSNHSLFERGTFRALPLRLGSSIYFIPSHLEGYDSTSNTVPFPWNVSNGLCYYHKYDSSCLRPRLGERSCPTGEEANPYLMRTSTEHDRRGDFGGLTPQFL